MLYSVIFKGLNDEDMQTIKTRFSAPILAKTGVRLDAQETRKTINSLTAVNNEALVVDLDAVDDSALIDSMYAYRTQRPETRVIIYAPGRKPDDVVLTRLSSLGVCNIIVPEEIVTNPANAIIEALTTSPVTYTLAANIKTCEKRRRSRFALFGAMAGKEAAALKAAAKHNGIRLKGLMLRFNKVANQVRISVRTARAATGEIKIFKISKTKAIVFGSILLIGALGYAGLFIWSRDVLNESKPGGSLSTPQAVASFGQAEQSEKVTAAYQPGVDQGTPPASSNKKVQSYQFMAAHKEYQESGRPITNEYNPSNQPASNPAPPEPTSPPQGKLTALSLTFVSSNGCKLLISNTFGVGGLVNVRFYKQSGNKFAEAGGVKTVAIGPGSESAPAITTTTCDMLLSPSDVVWASVNAYSFDGHTWTYEQFQGDDYASHDETTYQNNTVTATVPLNVTSSKP